MFLDRLQQDGGFQVTAERLEDMEDSKLRAQVQKQQESKQYEEDRDSYTLVIVRLL